MKIISENKHYSALGVVKFLAAIGIFYYHLVPLDHHWRHLFLLVEMFFMLTGYFTYKHFQKDHRLLKKDSIEKKTKIALEYSAKKFKAFLPYIAISLLLNCVHLGISGYRESGLRGIFDLVKHLPIELTFLSSQSATYNWPFWFLSAMAIVFPVFCLLCQNRKKHTTFIFSLLAVIVYYGSFFLNGDKMVSGIYGIGALIRAFFGLLAGVVVYHFAEGLRKKSLHRSCTVLLNFVELACLAMAIICTYITTSDATAHDYEFGFMLYCALYLIIFFSGKTLASKISSPVMDFLEKTSMVIYLVHVPLIHCAWVFGRDPSNHPAIFIAAVCVFSAILYVVVECIRAAITKKAKAKA